MTGVERTYRYCKWVHENPSQTNKWVKLAVDRFEKDIERSKQDDYPYKFDEKLANDFIIFSEVLKQSKGEFAGQPLHMEDWECFVMCNVMGWVYKETSFRRFRRAFVYVGRKNGKSQLASIPALWDVLTEPSAEVYTVATKLQQSRRVWEAVRDSVNQNPSLKSRLKIIDSTSRILNLKNGGIISALAADSKRSDGLNPSLIVADELAAMTNYDSIKVLQSGQMSRRNPLLLEITSGSDDVYSAGKLEFDVATKVLGGLAEDDNFFCILYCIDEEDQWDDEKVWIKANPNLGVSIKLDTLRKDCKDAQLNPAKRTEFITKICSRWSTPEKAWIQPEVWKKCMENIHTYHLDLSKPSYSIAAIDLSKRLDITAFTIATLQEGRIFLKHKFYFPLKQLRDKIHTDNELWEVWLQYGRVTGTPGDVVNYDIMFDDIHKLNEEYHFKEVLYDPYNAQNSLIPALQEEMNLVECKQNFLSMSPLIKLFEEDIYKANIVDDNPVMAWMMSNAEAVVDPNDNIKIVKPDVQAYSPKRIDGVITSSMAVGRIRTLEQNNEIDLRTAEQIRKETEEMLARIRNMRRG